MNITTYKCMIKTISYAILCVFLSLILSSTKPFMPQFTTSAEGLTIYPIVTLSESEALAIINREVKWHGLNFIKDGTSLQNIDIPYRYYIFNIEDNIAEKKRMSSFIINQMGSSIPIVATNKGNLSFDGYDANSKIGFIYLSKDDIDSSTNVKEFKDFAKSYTYYDVFSSVLSGNIKNNQKENKVWVFYNFRSIDKASAKKNLREQVQYFLNLLKA